MTSVESIDKKLMYRSHGPLPNNLYTQPRELKQSALQGKFRYERVDNMFKLVQIRSDNSDPKEQAAYEQDKIERICQTIQDLTTRVIGLEFQQAKFSGIERRISEFASLHRVMETNYNYLSQKITTLNQEMQQVKERLEQVEEQEGCFGKEIEEVIKIIKEVKVEEVRNRQENQDRLSQIIVQIKNQIIQQIKAVTSILKQPLREQINLNYHKAHKTVQEEKQRIYRLKYRQSYEMDGETYCLNDITYKIDKEGRLLDGQGCIILDSKNREIRLNEAHIKQLHDFGLLF